MEIKSIAKALALVLLSAATAIPASAQATSCGDYNSLTVYAPWNPFNNNGHINGYHYFYTNTAGTCSYQPVSGQTNCATICAEYGSASGKDTGAITPYYDDHVLGAYVNPGGAVAPGGGRYPAARPPQLPQCNAWSASPVAWLSVSAGE